MVENILKWATTIYRLDLAIVLICVVMNVRKWIKKNKEAFRTDAAYN